MAGASCSGKTTLAESLGSYLGATVLRQDDYYHPLDHLTYDQRCELNVDHPDAIDHALLGRHLDALRRGEAIDAPHYDFTRHTRFAEPQRIEPGSITIVEGIFVLYYPEVVALADLLVFVDAPGEVCLRRRLQRDVAERGRTSEEVIGRFNGDVWPMYLQYTEPSRRNATLEVSGVEPLEAGLEAVLTRMPKTAVAH